MSLTAPFLLADVATQGAPAAETRAPDRGAQFDSARVSVTILQPAEIKGGELISSANADSPRSQRQSGAGYVTYLFE
jgi:hypothetical protein